MQRREKERQISNTTDMFNLFDDFRHFSLIAIRDVNVKFDNIFQSKSIKR
jgi:hypothetical protein